MQRILTVCTGNICRSPMAEFAMKAHFPDRQIGSAGLHALVGRDMDDDSRAATEQMGLATFPHAARQFDVDLSREHDLILVMEAHHRHEIAAKYPHAVGKTFLLGHFDNAREVPDPYRSGLALHLRAAELILEHTAQWAAQIRALER